MFLETEDVMFRKTVKIYKELSCLLFAPSVFYSGAFSINVVLFSIERATLLFVTFVSHTASKFKIASYILKRKQLAN